MIHVCCLCAAIRLYTIAKREVTSIPRDFWFWLIRRGKVMTICAQSSHL